jgi:hypothetical protein
MRNGNKNDFELSDRVIGTQTPSNSTVNVI